MGLRLKSAPRYAAERDLELDVAQAPGPLRSETSANAPPTTKSLSGPAALIAMRRRRGSNQASEVSTNAYGKISTILKPARATRRP